MLTSPTWVQMVLTLAAKNSVKDTARVLGSKFDGIEYRGFSQRTVKTLAEYSGVPVIMTFDGLKGVPAVIDKDKPSALLANNINADTLAGKLGTTITA